MATLKLKVIALISGGKDSLFSILHCLANGHEIVALANLHPPILANDEQSEDIDSFMYQTVGHNIIPLYAEALGIPLFRRAITGGAINDEREYAPPTRGEDETEDLVPLLRHIKEAIPEANAVSTGAILSTYQRTRVESVAVRLGLTPLSYLWQYLYLPPYKQTSLLDDMRGVGQDARIIKVASGGLNESFLWQDVADESVISRMRRRMGMYGGGEGGALIGEGGEFETLAVDGPRPLWKKRIEVESVEKVAGEGGSSFARLKGARLVGKREKEGDEMDGLRVPSLLDDEFVQALHKLEALPGPMTTGSPSLKPVGAVNCWTHFVARDQRVQDIDATSGYLQLASIMSPPHSSTASQMTDIVHQTLSKLHVLGLEPSDILHSTILLRDMSTFATINPIYGSMFTKPSPASRVTVSCGELMPPAVDIVLSIVVNTDKGRGRRQGLHVQSRSYWAPANIGPYSQAISLQLRMKEFEEDQSAWLEPRLVHVAGQIPLLPASMEIVTAEQLLLERGAETTSEKSNDFLAQSVLSLQHLWRIGRAMDVMAWIGAVAFISRCPEHEEARRASIACDAWISIHNVLDPSKKDAASHEALASNDGEEDSAEEYDVWDVKNKVVQLSSSTAEEKDPRQHLPDYFRVKYDTVDNPPVFVTQVAELPRGAAIEWCSAGIAAASQVRYSSSQQAENLEQTCSVRTSEHSETEFTFAAFDSMEGLNAFTSRESDDASRTLTAYITKPLPQVFWERFEPMLVPCFSIWGKKGEQLKQFEALIVMRKDISIENH